MKNKKILHGFMAGALLLGLVSPLAASFIAKADSLENGRVGWYTFDDGTLQSQVGEAEATAIMTGLGSYSGTVTYDTNRGDEEGKSIRLGDYGLKLNQQNLGDDFSVSMWLKPDSTMSENQSVLFLGYHNPEQWLAVAGNQNSSANCKIWANGNGYSWKTLGTADITATGWHHLVLEGTADGVMAYLDGTQVATGTTNAPLNGTNQDIYVGVTNWDGEFVGLVDDVMVYDRALTEGEIERIYTDKKPEQLLEEEGISVEDIKMPVGRTAAVEVTMPEAVLEEEPTVRYAIADETVATVDAEGKMTALKVGETKLTVSVSLGFVKKTAEANVLVEDMDNLLTASYSFDENYKNQVSGGVDATAVYRPGPENGIEEYTGDVSYAVGRNGQAIALADYGLKLNQENLGKEYTVSMWVQPKATMIENQVVLMLGYHSPEKWIAISGSTTADECKIWGNGGSLSYQYMYYPEVPADEWSQLTLTGTSGKMSAYLNGILIGTTNSNDPLDGENQDIYIGVNNWDLEFNGLVDDLKVYNIALTETEIQEQMAEDLAQILQEKLEAEASLESILGENESADAIKYDLNLPATAANLPIQWTSSNTDVLGADGVVVTAAADVTVTLTGTISTGALQASVSYELKVVALDRTVLDALIAKAEAISAENLAEASVTRLQQAIQEAKNANTFTAIETAYRKLDKVCNSLCYMEDYMNPFALIADPETEVSVKVGESKTVFELPAEVLDAVDVVYSVEETATVSYADGSLQGLAAGKTIVTATVTAKYDGWQMEYSTAVEVTANQTTPGGDSGSTGGGSNNNRDDDDDDESGSSNSGSTNTGTDTAAPVETTQDTTLIQTTPTPLADAVPNTTPNTNATVKPTGSTVQEETKKEEDAATAEIEGKEEVEKITEEEVAKDDAPDTTQEAEKAIENEVTTDDQATQNNQNIDTQNQKSKTPIVVMIVITVTLLAGGATYIVIKKKKQK